MTNVLWPQSHTLSLSPGAPGRAFATSASHTLLCSNHDPPVPSPFLCQTLTVLCHVESLAHPMERVFLCPLDRGDLEPSATCLSSHSKDRLRRPPRAVLSRSGPPATPHPCQVSPLHGEMERGLRGPEAGSRLRVSPAPPVRQRQTQGLVGSPPGQLSLTPPQALPPSPRVHTTDADRASTVSQLCSGSWGHGQDETDYFCS